MTIRKILSFIWRVLRILLLALLILIFVGSVYRVAAREIFGIKSATVFGYSWAVVLTGSMSEAIEPNDIIVTGRRSAYEVGDIIAFYMDETPITHRIISAGEKGYRTKGDANNTDDGQDITKDNIIGKVVLIIPKAGALIRLARTPMGVFSALMIFALVIGLFRITDCVRGRKN